LKILPGKLIWEWTKNITTISVKYGRKIAIETYPKETRN
jgi:hypothetical protein